VITAFGTFLTGFAAIFGVIKYILNSSIKNETLYGEEAKERYKQIKQNLFKIQTLKLKTVVYGGGDNLKVPRLEIEKLSSNSKILGKEWKGRKAIIKYYKEVKEEGEEKKKVIVKRWLL
jgi:hypothetical protein